MKKMRNLTISLLLAVGVTGSAWAATGTVSHVERDDDLRAEMAEVVPGGVLAVLLANVFVVATGFRIAKQRSLRTPRPRQPILDAHDRVFDVA
jgi:hypothetical protein